MRINPATGVSPISFRQRDPRAAGNMVSAAVIRATNPIIDQAAQVEESKRLREANEAAQMLNFERDENNRLIAPELPKNEQGLFGPSIFDEAYTQQVTDRYAKQVVIDARADLTEIANQHPLDPGAYEAAAEGYLSATLGGVLPSVRGDISLSIQSVSVEHYNRIARQRAAFDFEESTRVHTQAFEHLKGDLGDLTHQGAAPEQIAGVIAQAIELVEQGRLNNFVDDAGRDIQLESIQRVVLAGSLSRDFKELPNTAEANTNAILAIEEMIENGGEIELPTAAGMERFDVEEVFPGVENRRATLAPVISYLETREAARVAREQLVHSAQAAQFNRLLVTSIADQSRMGRPITDADKTRLESLQAQALASNNFSLASSIGGVFDLNQDMVNALAAQRDSDHFDDAQMKLVLSELGSMPPEQIDAINKIAFDTAGQDIFQILSDPAGLFQTQADSTRLAIDVINAAAGSGGGSTPAWMDPWIRQSQNLIERQQKLQADWVKTHGEPKTIADRQAMWASIAGQLPNFVLGQTKNNAQYMDTILGNVYAQRGDVPTTARGDIDWAEVDMTVASGIINNDISKYGVIPSSLRDYVTGVFNQPETIGNDDFVQALDLARMIYDRDQLRSKMGATEGFGMPVTGALNAVFGAVSPGSVRDTVAIREIFKRALSGDAPFLDFEEFVKENGERLGERVVENVDGRLADRFTALFITDPNEVAFFRDVDIPPDLRDQVERLVFTNMRYFDLQDEDQLDDAVNWAINSATQSGGWAMSELGFSQALDGVPIGFAFDGMSLYSNMGPLISTLQKNPVLSRFAPEALYKDENGNPDELALQVIREKTQERINSHPLAQKQKLRLGANVRMQYNQEMSMAEGEPVYNLIAITEDRQGHWLQEEDGTFVSVRFGNAIAEAEGARVRKLESENEEMKKRRQQLQRVTGGGGGQSGANLQLLKALTKREDERIKVVE